MPRFWSSPAFGRQELKGTGDMKVRFKDGSVGIFEDVFCDESLNSNLLSTNVFYPYFSGVVKDKLIRFDTGAEIGYMTDGGAPAVESEVLDFDSPIEPTVSTKKPQFTAACLKGINGPISTQDREEGHIDMNDNDETDGERGLADENDNFTISVDKRAKAAVPPSFKPSKLAFEWHAKLGHPGQKAFQKTKKDLRLHGADHVPMSYCDTCLFGKATVSMPKVSHNLDPVTRPFEIIHVDLGGTFTYTPGWDDSTLFLTIVDAFAGKLHACPVKTIDAGTVELLKYLLETYTSRGSKGYPRQLRSDNGTEFLYDNV